VSKQDRQGARTIEQLNGQYGKTFAQAYNLANDAMKEAMSSKENAADIDAKYTSEVMRLDNQIGMTVTKVTDAASTADAAMESAENAMKEAKTISTTLTVRADGMDVAVTKIREEVGTKAEKAQVEELTEHFRFAEDGMTITNSGTGMGIGVSEKRVIFTGGDDPTTVITPNAMETTNLNVGVRLDVGGFAWLPRNNKNLSLRWVGG
jgi:hypothetical protein